MLDRRLINYIEKAISKGILLDRLKKHLILHGYNHKYVEIHINEVLKNKRLRIRKTLIFSVISLIVVISFIFILYKYINNEDYLFTEAIKDFKKEDYEQAINRLNKAVKLNPSNSEYYTFLGLSYFKQNKFDEGILYFERALELNPNENKAYRGLGFVYLSKGNYSEAIKNFKIAIKLKKKDAKSHYGMGLAYYYIKNYNESIKHLNKTLELDPNNDNARIIIQRIRNSS